LRCLVDGCCMTLRGFVRRRDDGNLDLGIVRFGRSHTIVQSTATLASRRSYARGNRDVTTNRRPRTWSTVLVVSAIILCARAAAAVEKRKLPDYGGHGPDPTPPGDVALWVPRVALAPAYVVVEYGLRRPLGAGIAGAERAHLPETLYNFFF